MSFSVLEHIEELLEKKVTFSDMVVRQNAKIWIRTPDGWSPSNDDTLDEESMLRIVQYLMEESDISAIEERIRRSHGSFDVSRNLNERFRLRANLYFHGGDDATLYGIALRIQTREPTPWNLLPYGASLPRLVMKEKGLWFVVGTTGQGKSTTMASLLAEAASSGRFHILTLEDPAEYRIPAGQSIITTREIGDHADSFQHALEAAVRQRPDAILIGEIRDAASLEATLWAAETGHAVLASLHARNVEEALVKVVSMSLNRERTLASLAMILSGVLAQTLVPSVDKTKWIMAHELYLANQEGQQDIRRGEIHKIRNAITAGRSQGCRLLNDSLEELLRVKAISVESAMDASYDKSFFRGGTNTANRDGGTRFNPPPRKNF